MGEHLSYSPKLQRYIDWSCMGCGRDTIGEYYMVHGWIWNMGMVYYWEQSVAKTQARQPKFLCIECLERALGRALNPEDFTVCLLNSTSTSSVILSLRSGRTWKGRGSAYLSLHSSETAQPQAREVPCLQETTRKVDHLHADNESIQQEQARVPEDS